MDINHAARNIAIDVWLAVIHPDKAGPWSAVNREHAAYYVDQLIANPNEPPRICPDIPAAGWKPADRAAVAVLRALGAVK